MFLTLFTANGQNFSIFTAITNFLRLNQFWPLYAYRLTRLRPSDRVFLSSNEKSWQQNLTKQLTTGANGSMLYISVKLRYLGRQRTGNFLFLAYDLRLWRQVMNIPLRSLRDFMFQEELFKKCWIDHTGFWQCLLKMFQIFVKYRPTINNYVSMSTPLCKNSTPRNVKKWPQFSLRRLKNKAICTLSIKLPYKTE